jgi:hypothetical protein
LVAFGTFAEAENAVSHFHQRRLPHHREPHWFPWNQHDHMVKQIDLQDPAGFIDPAD